MARNVGSTKGDKKKCDVLFSKIVRSRGHCENCGHGDYAQLQTAHIISRRFAHTRTVETNALCLCARCHSYYTDYPVDFAAFVERTIGDGVYADLLELSQQRKKFDWALERERLKERWESIEAAF